MSTKAGSQQTRTLAGEMFYTALGVPVVVGLILVLERYAFPMLSFWVGAIATGITTVVIVGYSLEPKQLQVDIERDMTKGELGDFYLFGLPCLHFVSAALLFRGIWVKYGSTCYANLPESPTILDWLAFTADRFGSVVLFDIPDAYGLRLSPIEHQKQFWMGTAVLVYKLGLAIGFVSLIISSYNYIHRRRP